MNKKIISSLITILNGQRVIIRRLYNMDASYPFIVDEAYHMLNQLEDAKKDLIFTLGEKEND